MIASVITLSTNTLSPDIWEAIYKGHGFYITFAGMAAVFVGLVVIWAAINLNRLLVEQVVEKKSRIKDKNIMDESLSPTAMAMSGENLEEIAVIMAATCAWCEEFEDDNMEILQLKNIAQDVSPWVVVAREQMMRNQ